jgi:phage virion morphogenesis protein
MADHIDIKINDQQITAYLTGLRRKVENMRPIMAELAADMLDEVRENFAHEGLPNPWKKSKRAQKQGGMTLQDTRRLYNSIHAASGSTFARVGTNVRYAAIHHFGGVIKQPARIRTLRMRDGFRGPLLPGGKRSNDTFANKRRASYTMQANSDAYSITMPARPFLQLTPAGTQVLVRRMKRYLEI